ncbi:HNH endonuclease [uncultured Corynebacterium sp.]|uniref:HNH endonuclease n=1 Tax=uncultured Corynebacterium sp. TaxID=159447 RepID=UPI0025912D1E|nr:HNH endonuclease signature motif containing protein [uncultured Corynebacterium sp.]
MARKKPMPPEVAEIVTERAQGMCEIMSPDAGCNGRAEQLHHRKLRKQGGEHTVENLVHICHHCHNYLHAHPAIAYTNGWLVKSTKNPRDIPVNRRGGFIMLTPDGELEAATVEPLDV